MHFIEIMKSSLSTLKANGRRTFLTMFGIIIGVASVITIMSLGNGFKAYTIDSLSANDSGNTSQEFFFQPTNFEKAYRKDEIYSQVNLQYIKQMDGVTDVEVSDGSNSFGSYLNTKIRGEENSANTKYVKDMKEVNMVAGRRLRAEDSKANKPYAVISTLVLADAYETPEEAIGQLITIEGTTFTIVGISEEQPMSFISLDFEESMSSADLYLPEGSEQRFASNDQSGMSYRLEVFFEAETDLKRTSESIQKYLNNEGAGKDKGEYQYIDTAEIMESIGQVLNTITYFISAIAGISLFIAGVGVMNMMYISVSERTKEIGIRRALGANKRSIQTQFLLEGIVITTIGGIIGYILGILVANGVSQFLPFHSVIDLGTAALAVIISVAIGIVFSVFPAKAAANKNVIDILR